MDTAESRAATLVHTESAHIAAEASLAGYKETGVQCYTFDATLDSKTCSYCGQMDQLQFPLSEQETGVNYPPLHPRCRCTTLPVTGFQIGSKRAARNPGTGKTEYVKKGLTYEEWWKKYVEDDAEAYEKLRSEARKKQSDLNDASRSLSQIQVEKKLLTLGGYTDKVERLAEKEAAIQEKIKSLQSDLENLFKDANIKSEVGQKLFTSSIDWLPSKALDKSLSVDEIIDKLGGGDQTKGSCSSLGFAYAGNHNGLDITDFRGGASREFFSQRKNILAIAKLPGVSSVVENSYNDITGATKVLKTMAEDKLYYLATGRHAAIVRKLASGGYEYLELQTVSHNGFHSLTRDILKSRFDCQRSHTYHGEKYACDNILIDIDSLNGNQEFENILGYLNTQADKQMKGGQGYAK